MNIQKCFLFFAALIISCTAWSQTSITGGLVYGHWTVSGSPYIVSGDIAVADTSVLTIDPGVDVLFQGYYGIQVDGSLKALGQKHSPIEFIITDTNGFSNHNNTNGAWKGVVFNKIPSSIDSSYLHHCLFSHTKSISAIGNGGAVFIDSTSAIAIDACEFVNNYTAGNGAGIAVYKSSPVIKHCFFIMNEAAKGGGLFLDGAGGSVINNVFHRNFATSQGGAVVFTNACTTRFTGNEVSKNGGNLGGGIAFWQSNGILANNTIVFNKANYGGGIVCLDSDPSFTNSILYGNECTSIGPQLAMLDDNSDPDFHYCDIEGDSAAFGYGIGLNVYTGSFLNNLDLYPVFEDTAMADFALGMTSPVLDKGKADTSGLYLPATDFHGNPRINHGRIDMGAYERPQLLSVCGIINTNTLWLADTVRISCDVTISPGVELLITPGVRVEFDGHYHIHNYGIIQAYGMHGDSILFTSRDTTGFANIAVSNGGWEHFILDTGSTSVFDYCVFEYGKNYLGTNPDTYGGAILVYHHDNALIKNCRFTNNIAKRGGAVAFTNGGGRIENSLFNWNYADDGGAFFSGSSNSYLISNSFFNNYSTTYGGAYYLIYSKDSIINSEFCNNESASGGAVFIYTVDSVLFANNTIANNKAIDGGGFYIYYADTQFWYNTIWSGNQATNSGDQFYLSSPDYLNFLHCLIEGDTTGFEYSGSFNGNFIQLIDSSAEFSGPSSGAGILYSGLNADWSLSGCSPAINKGYSDTSNLLLPTMDLSGNSRIIGDTIDIGAYELDMPVVGVQPQSAIVCDGQDTSFVFAINGNVPVNYQWQQSLDSGLSWSDTLGMTLAVMDLNSVSSAYDGRLYRCIASVPCLLQDTSVAVGLQVFVVPVITQEPLTAHLCEGGDTSFSVQAQGGMLSWQWEYSIDAGMSWNNVSGANGPVMPLNNVGTAENGKLYRCVISGYCSPADTSVSVFAVVDTLPSINVQPIDQVICMGQDAQFSTSASGTALTYQWQYSPDGGISWIDTTGMIQDQLNLTAPHDSLDGYLFRCELNGVCGSAVFSQSAILSVYTSPQLINQPLDAVVCAGSDTSFMVSAGGGGLSYQWQYSADSGSTWVNTGADTNLLSWYSALQVQSGYLFRCLVSGYCAGVDTSQTVMLAVHAIHAVFIGNDTTLKLSHTIDLDAGAGFASYLWSTSQTTQQVSLPGSQLGVGPIDVWVTVTDTNGCQASDTINITVIDDTGLEGFATTRLKVYPNPASEGVYIDIPDASQEYVLSVFDLLGKEILKLKIDEGKNQIEIPLRGMENGFYTLIMLSESKIYKCLLFIE